MAFWVSGAAAAALSGRVVGVSDGDTLTLLADGGRRVVIRLAEIDAPEDGQAFGQRAKEALSRMVAARYVRVETSGRDQYGRTLGRVFTDGRDVNAELVRSGAAWAYRQYLADRALVVLENEARAARRGLWAASTAIIPPWVYRRPVSRTAPARATCGGKNACSQMRDCAEARHYLEVCRVQALDGDGDGIPCNALCRP